MNGMISITTMHFRLSVALFLAKVYIVAYLKSQIMEGCNKKTEDSKNLPVNTTSTGILNVYNLFW